MVEQYISIGLFGLSHAMNIISVSTTSIGLSDSTRLDRQRQMAESVTGCVATSVQGFSPVVEDTVCIITVFSKAILDLLSKPAEAFWGWSLALAL